MIFRSAFGVGIAGTWMLAVGNNGPSTVAGTTTVTDVLPAGITYVDGTGDGWTCSENNGTVTCESTATVPAGGSFPIIELTVEVDAAETVRNVFREIRGVFQQVHGYIGSIPTYPSGCWTFADKLATLTQNHIAALYLLG